MLKNHTLTQTKDPNDDDDVDDSFCIGYVRVWKLSKVHYSVRMGRSLVGLVVDKINCCLVVSQIDVTSAADTRYQV